MLYLFEEKPSKIHLSIFQIKNVFLPDDLKIDPFAGLDLHQKVNSGTFYSLWSCQKYGHSKQE